MYQAALIVLGISVSLNSLREHDGAAPSWTDDNMPARTWLRRPFPAWPQMPFQSFFSLAFILPMTGCGNRMKSKIYWLAIFQRRAENLDLTANSPIQSKHRRIEIADDQLDASSKRNIAQCFEQYGGSKKYLLLFLPYLESLSSRQIVSSPIC